MRAEGQERWRGTVARKQTAAAPATLAGSFVVKNQYGSRYWMVIDPVGELVCLTVKKEGRGGDRAAAGGMKRNRRRGEFALRRRVVG